ncbi:hypothetical protein BDV12DRAFT_169579 [Aspergillus spectabilis]
MPVSHFFDTGIQFHFFVEVEAAITVSRSRIRCGRRGTDWTGPGCTTSYDYNQGDCLALSSVHYLFCVSSWFEDWTTVLIGRERTPPRAYGIGWSWYYVLKGRASLTLWANAHTLTAIPLASEPYQENRFRPDLYYFFTPSCSFMHVSITTMY